MLAPRVSLVLTGVRRGSTNVVKPFFHPRLLHSRLLWTRTPVALLIRSSGTFPIRVLRVFGVIVSKSPP